MNRLTSVLSLPPWCQNDEGRALCEAIIDEQPDFFVRSGQWIEGGGVRRYKGKNAGALRKLHRERHLELDQDATELFIEGLPWDIAAHDLHAFLAAEEPDALIERLVEGFTVMSPKQLSDPLKGVEP